MTTRNEKLAEAINQLFPGVKVETSWTSFDWEKHGVRIQARNADITGNALCATKDDVDLERMTDDEVLEWAEDTITKHQARQATTREAKRVQREMDAK